MSLAGEEPLKLELDLVQHEENVVAAKFTDLQQGRQALRTFLFNSDKIKYPQPISRRYFIKFLLILSFSV
ncbi:hypothetical protein CMT41_11175 [Colwellia sp. MT41]|nr:hypothetical protein CMT41_11175 [Colwellia sp. MT41]